MIKKEVEQIKELIGEVIGQNYKSIEYTTMMKNLQGTAGVVFGSGFFVG